MTAFIEMQGRISPIRVEMKPIEVIQKMDDAGHNGRMMVLLNQTDTRIIAINMLNVISVEEEDAGDMDR